jgi:hypothetical protein
VAARETLAAWHPSLWDDENIGRVAVKGIPMAASR